MLSHSLIQSIEDHCDSIITSLIWKIREDPELPHLRSLSEAELREWGSAVVRNLGDWILAGKERALAKRYEDLGRLRFKESVPLYEAVRGIQLLKDKLISFVRDSGFAQTAAQVYAEEQLEFLVGRFFDWLIFHLVRGYEEALRSAGHLAA